jgi:uncharacterized DUF497 family protein
MQAVSRFEAAARYNSATMKLEFEWDAAKARENQTKQGVSFDEASTVFGDPLALTIPDALHSDEDDRFVSIGMSYRNRLLVVVFAERKLRLRLISARRAHAA